MLPGLFERGAGAIKTHLFMYFLQKLKLVYSYSLLLAPFHYYFFSTNNHLLFLQKYLRSLKLLHGKLNILVPIYTMRHFTICLSILFEIMNLYSCKKKYFHQFLEAILLEPPESPRCLKISPHLNSANV